MTMPNPEQLLISGGIDTGADFSLDRAYRYRLWRIWDATRRPIVYVLLNPSTADAQQNDPTVTRCIIRARQLDAGGAIVVNLFALCATDPRVMKAHPEPIGRDNDEAILTAAGEAGLIIGGWGAHGTHRDRARSVLGMLRDAGHVVHHLGLTKAGHPTHPLYIGYGVQPQPIP